MTMHQQISARFTREGDLLILKTDRLIDEIRFDRVSAQAFVDQLSAFLTSPALQKPVLRLVKDESPPEGPSLPEIMELVKKLQQKVETLVEEIERRNP
jgi:hypothetical protein